MSEQQPAGLRSSWVWVLSIFTIASLIDAGFFGQMVAFTPLHLEALGLSPDQVTTYTGLISSLTWAVGIPFLPLWGALADRYSRQPVIARSFLAFLVAGVFMFFARDVFLFALGRSLMSFALGNSGLMMTTLTERVPKHRIGLAFAIMNSAAPIGFFVGPLAGGPVVDALGLRGLLLIDMALILLVTLGISFGYRDTYHGSADQPLWRMVIDSVLIVVRSPKVRTLFAGIFVVFLGWEGVLPYIPLAVTKLYQGTDPGTAIGIVVGVGGLATMIIGPAAGALADRFGRWRVLFIGAALAVLLLPLPIFARTIPSLTLIWGVANGVISAIFALSFTVLADSAPEETRARVMSFAYLPTNAGAAIGPALASMVAGVNLNWVFPAAALLTLPGIGVLALAYRQVQAASAPTVQPAEASASSG